ncbi:MAG: hypothetical protein WC563_15670 [Brevundimonas sp.]
MVQYAEVTRTNDGADSVDIPMYNNSATAIGAGLGVLYETVTGKPRAVALPTNGGGVARSAGVTVTSIPAGGYGMVCVLGPVLMVAHDVILPGEFVEIKDVTAHLGEGKLAVVTASHCSLGYCLQASGVDSDIFEVFVSPNYQNKAA